MATQLVPPRTVPSNGITRASVPMTAEKPIWDLELYHLESWLRSMNVFIPKVQAMSNEERAQKAAIGNTLMQNLSMALKSLLTQSTKVTSSEPPTKRLKTEINDEPPEVHDPYGIWVGQNEEPPSKEGAIVVQLTTAGWINALAGLSGGVVSAKLILKNPEIPTFDTFLPSAANVSVQELRNYAQTLHRVVQTRLETDFLWSTPSRIIDMLASDLAPHEFSAVRRRVHETVIEGRGRNPGALDEGDDIPVASRVDEHDIERDKKCKVCGNQDQAEFTLDRKNGDIICTACGTVAMESLMHEGSQFRKFEGEVDRNHHGDAPNKLFSNAHNMATTLGGIQMTSSAGGPGFGSQKKGIEQVLRNAHAYTELNISQFGKGERKTRVGYKDRQKKDAFVQMTHVGDALHLHEAVVQRAKEIFAGFRDDRELVQSFKPVICACLVIAFEELSKSGMQLMKQRQQQDAEARLSQRANKRNELHNASMAGKGGIVLDMRKVKAEKTDDVEVSALEKKQASRWDLDDCRSWMLEASRRIVQVWLEERKEGKVAIPLGTQEEIEGKLVEHSLNLCDQLEAELKQKIKDVEARKPITPRVKDMANLSIRWQHGHERGSGGKGGVGNSGRAVNGVKPGEQTERTAGQILILKTAKKLGSMVNDPLVGEAFHRELRSLLARQESRKTKVFREEVARQRFNQMQRKSYLQIRTDVKS